MATRERDVQSEQRGLTFARHFTSEGTHPYDEVEWEVRDDLGSKPGEMKWATLASRTPRFPRDVWTS